MATKPAKMKGGLRQTEFTIANGATVSDALELNGGTLVGLQIPVAMTGATLAIQCSLDGGATWFAVKDAAGTAKTVVANATGFYKFPPADFDGIYWLRFVSSSAEGADRTLTAVFADYKV